MQTYADYINDYFKRERKNLNRHYPGLTIHRLLAEIPVNDLADYYIPHASHPLHQFLIKLSEGVPLEYISHRAYFFKSSFYVNPHVLIPRSETEILVELAIREIQTKFKGKAIEVADICTGSGIIGLSVLREGGAEISMTMSDLSLDALEVAKKNYFCMQFLFSKNHAINFIQGDRFLNISSEFDLILSNPPYIKKQADRHSVHSQVLTYEPSMALFIDDHEYENWFSNFFQEIKNHLKPDGMAIIEGHEDHLESLKLIAQDIGFKKIDLIKDYTIRNRFIKLVK